MAITKMMKKLIAWAGIGWRIRDIVYREDGSFALMWKNKYTGEEKWKVSSCHPDSLEGATYR